MHWDLRAVDNGPLSIWEPPKASHEAIYVIGADVAEGLEHGDASSAHVINVNTGKVAAHFHGRLEADEFADELYMLGSHYHTALLCIEANNHGLTTITLLRKMGYSNIWRRRDVGKADTKVSLQFGFKTTVNTKPLLIDELGRALRNDELEIPCAATLGEMVTYVRDERGRMNGSPHDDRVMSLALANYVRPYAHLPEYRPRRDDYLTLDWWGRQIRTDAGEAKPLVIGGGRRR